MHRDNRICNIHNEYEWTVLTQKYALPRLTITMQLTRLREEDTEPGDESNFKDNG